MGQTCHDHLLPAGLRRAFGIFGFSWGGYSTTLLSGLLGDKVKAAYAVFGCGFYDKGSVWKDGLAAMSDADRQTWVTYLDAGRRAPNIKAAYFLEGASNDTFFWPEAVGATLDAVPGNTKNHVWGPNLNHKQLPSGPTMISLHMDYYLKGLGQPFASVKVSAIASQPDGSKLVTLAVAGPAGVTVDKTELYYSDVAATWQNRTWISVPATPIGPNQYAATLAPDVAAKAINFYGFVTDTRLVSTSTAMYDSSSVVVPGAAGSGGAGGDGVIGGSAGSLGGGGGGSTTAGGASVSGSGTGGSLLVAGSSSGGAPGGGGTSAAQAPPDAAGCACRLASPNGASAARWSFALALLALRRRKARQRRR